MTTSELLAAVDASITSNHSGEITGAALNTLLKNMINNIGGTPTFAFPNDTSSPVTSSDVGKLAMNDGSGTAKVYALLSAATTETAGSWQIILNSTAWSELTSNSSLTIYPLDGESTYVDRNIWRSGASTPTTPAEELALIKSKIDSFDLGLTVTVVGTDTLTIVEPAYSGIQITAMNMPDDVFSVVQYSRPASPEAPTAFPLGKIVGLKDSDVLISSALIETYILDGSLTLDNSLFNSANYGDLNGNDYDTLLNISKMLAVPSSSGKVKQFDITRYDLDSTFPEAFRDQIVGLILSSSNNTITVFNANFVSPILNIFLKLTNRK